MAYTAVDKSSSAFKAVKYNGTGSSNAITGVGHQPDFLWIKKANGTEHHILIDAIRGLDKQVYSSHNSSQDTNAQSVTAVGADGFTVGINSQTNDSSNIFIAQTWKGANGTASNASGSITSTVSANTTAGISICTWTGTGSAATIGHGLGAVPKTIFIKNVSTTNDWNVYHELTGNTHRLFLNGAIAREDNASAFNDTSPTSTVFSIGTNTNVNQNGDTIVAYCFAEKRGFSKFGFYKGSGNADGPFIYTGFKPAFVIVKNYEETQAWVMWNQGLNPTNQPQFFHHHPNTTDTWVDNTNNIDVLSNGFKIRTSNSTGPEINNTQYDHVYWAFAEAPLVGSNNIPCTAR